MNKIIIMGLVSLMVLAPITAFTSTNDYQVSYYTSNSNLFINVVNENPNASLIKSTATYYVGGTAYETLNFYKQTNMTLPVITGELIITLNGSIKDIQKITTSSNGVSGSSGVSESFVYEMVTFGFILTVVASAISTQIVIRRNMPGKIKNSYNEDSSAEIRQLKENAVYVKTKEESKKVYDIADKLMKKYSIDPKTYEGIEEENKEEKNDEV